MKIDQMLLRENFYLINEKTLQSYYKTVHGIDTVISTHKRSLLRDAFIYPKINSIISRFPSKKVRNYIFAEFNARNNFVKYLQWKLFSALCLYSGGLTASNTLNFAKSKPINKDILIWPCNRKIRIFNFDLGYVDSIIKDGFTKKYFNKEVSFRLNTNYSFVPKISSHGDNWYREHLLIGQPLARIKDNEQFEKSSIETISNIKKIVQDTIKYINVDKYVTVLFNRIDELVLNAKKRKNISTGNDILNLATIASKNAKLIQSEIPFALSHGDLQSGNLWVDTKNRRTLIIDWETNDYRSIWYDPATFLLSTRRDNGVYDMITNRNSEKVKNAVLINDSIKTYNMDGVIGIIILEDIVFCLEDNLELQSNWGKENIDQLGKQLKKIKWE